MVRIKSIKIFNLQQNVKYKVLAFKSVIYNGETKCSIRLLNPQTNEISETFLPNTYMFTQLI